MAFDVLCPWCKEPLARWKHEKMPTNYTHFRPTDYLFPGGKPPTTQVCPSCGFKYEWTPFYPSNWPKTWREVTPDE